MKKPFVEPTITVYGSVEDLTKQTVKTAGSNDGVSYDNGEGTVITIGTGGSV